MYFDLFEIIYLFVYINFEVCGYRKVIYGFVVCFLFSCVFGKEEDGKYFGVRWIFIFYCANLMIMEAKVYCVYYS